MTDDTTKGKPPEQTEHKPANTSTRDTASETIETSMDPTDMVGNDHVRDVSTAYVAFQSGDYARAAALDERSGGSADDPVDVGRALALDPAIPITGAILALVWVSVALSVL